VTLEGKRIRLEPLLLSHHTSLCEIGFDPELWKYGTSKIETDKDLFNYVALALQYQQDGTALPFIIREKSTGKIIGSTRYGNIDVNNRRVEIGWTWIARPWQRTYVNTETKYLMLKHAFEVLQCVRVEFKTDSMNHRSRTAILRIGAKEEGILRNHMILPTGRVRDSVYYSIIESEWEKLKKIFEGKLTP
jgi:RimJ/RimL family protein N-acetyltransferase